MLEDANASKNLLLVKDDLMKTWFQMCEVKFLQKDFGQN